MDERINGAVNNIYKVRHIRSHIYNLFIPVRYGERGNINARAQFDDA